MPAVRQEQNSESGCRQRKHHRRFSVRRHIDHSELGNDVFKAPAVVVLNLLLSAADTAVFTTTGRRVLAKTFLEPLANTWLACVFCMDVRATIRFLNGVESSEATCGVSLWCTFAAATTFGTLFSSFATATFGAVVSRALCCTTLMCRVVPGSSRPLGPQLRVFFPQPCKLLLGIFGLTLPFLFGLRVCHSQESNPVLHSVLRAAVCLP